MTPLVSICIPVYNGERYLRECLDSVLSQTHSDMEIIVVDDVSADGSAAILQEYWQKDKRIRLHRNEKNLGLVGNWNKCMELARGEWIKFVFQDDVIRPDGVEKMLKAAGDHAIAVSDRRFIYNGEVMQHIRDYYDTQLLSLKKMVSTAAPVFLDAKEISRMAVKHLGLNFIGEPTAVLFRKSIAEKIGPFNEDLTQICDLEYWLRIATEHGLVYVPEELILFRIHAGSTTAENVLSVPKFRPRYIDTLILSHELLSGKRFVTFRTHIRKGQKRRLINYLKIRMLEARKAFEKDLSIDRNFFNGLFRKYPELNIFYKISPGTKLLHSLLLLRRKLRKRK